MITKFDVGEEVAIRGVVTDIKINGCGADYTIRLEDGCYLYNLDEDTLQKAEAERKLSKLTDKELDEINEEIEGGD